MTPLHDMASFMQGLFLIDTGCLYNPLSGRYPTALKGAMPQDFPGYFSFYWVWAYIQWRLRT